MGFSSLLSLFYLALESKIRAKPTRSQLPGKHHAMRRGKPTPGKKLVKACSHTARVRGH